MNSAVNITCKKEKKKKAKRREVTLRTMCWNTQNTLINSIHPSLIAHNYIYKTLSCASSIRILSLTVKLKSQKRLTCTSMHSHSYEPKCRGLQVEHKGK